MTTNPTGALRRVLRLPHGPEARYAALDGYRGLAAVLVVVYHVGANQWTLVQNTVGARLVYGFGNMGVTLFFVLSGFLLFRPFAEKDLAGVPAPGVRRYAVNRLLRIVPAYWVALTVELLLLPHRRVDLTGDALDTLDYVKLYLFAQNYDALIGYAGLAVAWTLGIELTFYLALPGIAFVIRAVADRLTASRAGRLGVHLATLATLYGGAWLFRATVVRTNRGMADTYGLWLFNYLDWFALGMLLALLVSWRDLGGRIPRLLEVPAASTTLMWIAGASLYVLYAARLHNDFSVPETTTQIYSRFFWPGLAAFVVLLPATVGNARTDPLHRLFRTRLLLFAGTISYGLYLWHLPIIEKLKADTWWQEQALAYAFTMPFLVVLTVTTILATLSWFALEEPVLRLKHRLGGGSSARPVPATASVDAAADGGAAAFERPWFDDAHDGHPYDGHPYDGHPYDDRHDGGDGWYGDGDGYDDRYAGDPYEQVYDERPAFAEPAAAPPSGFDFGPPAAPAANPSGRRPRRRG